MDPISEDFPWATTYNYAENEPIANIDLWGLQKFYSADGSLIGSYGNSNEEWVINNPYNVEKAQKVFSNGDQAQRSYFSSEFTKGGFSRRLYRNEDLNQVYDDFAAKNKHFEDREVGFIVWESEIDFIDEEGNSFKGYQLGKQITQMRDEYPGATLIINKSSIVGSRGVGKWRKYSAIHTHPNDQDFSGIDKQSNGGPRSDFGVSNDLGCFGFV